AIPPRYGYTRAFRQGLAAVEIGDRWGYIDKSGAVAIAARYSSAMNFHEGYAMGCSGVPCIFIDRSGWPRLTGVVATYSVARFSGGLALVPDDWLFHPSGIAFRIYNWAMGRAPMGVYSDTSGGVVARYARE